MITCGWNLFSIHFKSESFYFYLVALDAFGGELVLIAASAVDVVLLRRQMSSQYSSKLKTPGLEMDTEDSHHLWNEALGADGIFASATNEAFLVPLSALVLHLLHPRLKYYLPQHPNL